MTPDDVREVVFPLAGRYRRGLDPESVYAFLLKVADEMDDLNRRLESAREDGRLAREGVRRWYAGQPTRLLPIVHPVRNRGRFNRRAL